MPNIHLQHGASLVGYSGDKCLRGPQAAGLLIGQSDLTRAAWFQASPHHNYGRAYKVGKEEIMGMLAAVRKWYERDHEAEQRAWRSWLHPRQSAQVAHAHACQRPRGDVGFLRHREWQCCLRPSHTGRIRIRAMESGPRLICLDL